MFRLRTDARSRPVFLAKMVSRLRGNDAENAVQLVPKPILRHRHPRA
jgi:hypothetical protein